MDVARIAENRDMDLSGYAVTRGRARNGSVYATLRKAGSPTLTGYGETADALVDAVVNGTRVSVEAYGRGKALKVASVSCPVTGLPVGERGRVAPIAVPAVLPEPVVAQPKGFWARSVEAIRELMGMETEHREPAPVEIAVGRTGYPVVDSLVDRIVEQLEDTPLLTDDNGARFDLLVERHIPRIAMQHAEATRGADVVERRQADAVLNEAVRMMDRHLTEAVARDRRVRMDALSTSLNFLKARSGADVAEAGLLTSIDPPERAALPSSRDATGSSSAKIPDGASEVLEAPRLAGIAKGPTRSDDGVVVHLHQAGRGAAR
jgi:hypothetical protein